MPPSNYPPSPVLLVDDEENSLLSESITLTAAGLSNIVECKDSRDVLSLLQRHGAELVVLDLTMPHVSGLELLPAIGAEHPEIPVIVLTGMNEVAIAVECMKSGAFDYLVKPVDDSRFISSVKRAIEHREIRNENASLKRYLLAGVLKHPEAFSSIVTQNVALHSIFKYVEAIATTPMPKLITGETGVGKELVARAIHDLSERKGDFVGVNVAGVDDTLFADTLFGHKKGAFTGADSDRQGLILKARHGTLFLDEIGDLRPESQVTLLRLLQEGKYYPLGSDVAENSDARIIVATNSDIDASQRSGRFRKDLYYRLQTHHIHIPPLRERLEDIPLLAMHFLEKAADTLKKKRPTPPRELFTLLQAYHYPGNVRELEGIVFDAVSQHESGVLSLESILPKIGPPRGNEMKTPEPSHGDNEARVVFTSQLPTLHEVSEMLITEALNRAKGNQTIAASILGISRRTLNNRLSRGRSQRDPRLHP